MEYSGDIRQAIEVLRNGGVILYPTDTIWGIGCDATNREAVKRVMTIKRRADHKQMLVLADGLAMLERYVDEVPDAAYQLLEVATTPLTLVLDGAHGVAPELLGDDNSLGIRITGERYSRDLCARLHKPIVSTSANISGNPSPATFADIDEQIKNAVDYIAEYRRDDTQPRAASSVIQMKADGAFKILRT